MLHSMHRAPHAASSLSTEDLVLSVHPLCCRWLLVGLAAWAHPGADQRAASTAATACRPTSGAAAPVPPEAWAWPRPA
jgi:hypothetical protein